MEIDISYEVQSLLNYGLFKGLLEKDDEIQARNSILETLQIDEYHENKGELNFSKSPQKNLDNILDWAYLNGILEEDTITYRDLLDSKLMSKLMARPSEFKRKFNNIRDKEGVKAATNWFYEISQASNYIRMDRIAKNRHWYSNTDYGKLEITINLSKPEKDPKAIMLAKFQKSSEYPKCLLCKENIGYAGRLNHPGRMNHRTLQLKLNDEPWSMQYSPYVYYNEHSIIFSDEHKPMSITKETFDKLTDFIKEFPHYFAGTNADLPIVGGSILSHDHFQGGNHKFPMEKASIETNIEFKDFPSITGGIVKWPMSVIRIKGDKEEIINLSNKILKKWRNYTNQEIGILAYTDEPHNTITPIARRRGEYYEMDLVLRNNRTTVGHPMGLFHPHEEVHHIKKENIGLIEVMGLAVLPGRLKDELEILSNYLIKENWREQIANSEDVNKHLNWCEDLKERYEFSSENAEEILKKEVGEKFSTVLEHAGVFKRELDGQGAFKRFVEQVNKIK